MRLRAALPDLRQFTQTLPEESKHFLHGSCKTRHNQRFRLAAACWPLLISSPPPFGKEQLAGDIPAKLGQLSLLWLKLKGGIKEKLQDSICYLFSIRGLNNHRNVQFWFQWNVWKCRQKWLQKIFGFGATRQFYSIIPKKSNNVKRKVKYTK